MTGIRLAVALDAPTIPVRHRVKPGHAPSMTPDDPFEDVTEGWLRFGLGMLVTLALSAGLVLAVALPDDPAVVVVHRVISDAR